MEILVYALASFVLLVPVLYFLPLGISRQGKNIIAVAAGVFAIAGGYGNGLFNLGQMALILILLIGTVAYIFDRKFGRILYTEEPRHAQMDNGEDVLIGQKSVEKAVVLPAVPVAVLSKGENHIADFAKSGDVSTLNGDSPGLLEDKMIETEDELSGLSFFDDLDPIPVSAAEIGTAHVEDLAEEKNQINQINHSVLEDSELSLFDLDSSELEVLEPFIIAAPVLEMDDTAEEDYFTALIEAAVAVEQEEEDFVKAEGARNG
ncbi:hypothetical protein [Bacillus sp. B-jedd]|uniref:hypothetical protein n=1 Tax=Bacillus sp. B-jedd TaxID=1476857 RepID=UPI0005156E3C|nr:hypothetical protein [Bacillus sp. B-jedd]CEG28036.1 hypothetical protein BN1002_02914 [Bacillus sp. B-jedd]